MYRQHLKAKVLALLLAVTLICSLFPASILAQATETGQIENEEVLQTVGEADAEILQTADEADAEPGSFYELQQLVMLAEASGQTLTLNKDYVYKTDTTPVFTTIDIQGSLTLDLNGHVIDGKKANNNSVITISKDATLTLMDSSATTENPDGIGKITGGKTEIYSGSLDSISEDSSTQANSTTCGGGIKVEGALSMYNGNIVDNEAGLYGGGVYVSPTGKVVTGGGNISDNTSGLAGGGVYIAKPKTTDRGVFLMRDSTVISENHAVNGGGVYNMGEFTMWGYGCTISGNTAEEKGGGVRNAGTFQIYSGNITGNTAGDQGGGVYQPSKGEFTIPSDGTGNPRVVNIIDNDKITGESKTANNVYLAWNQSISTKSIAFSETARIGVTTEDVPTKGTPVIIANGDQTSLFVSDDPAYTTAKVDDQVALILAEEKTDQDPAKDASKTAGGNPATAIGSTGMPTGTMVLCLLSLSAVIALCWFLRRSEQ